MSQSLAMNTEIVRWFLYAWTSAEKYAENLHDLSLVSARRVAALNNKNSRQAMRASLAAEATGKTGLNSDGDQANRASRSGDGGGTLGDLAGQSMVSSVTTIYLPAVVIFLVSQYLPLLRPSQNQDNCGDPDTPCQAQANEEYIELRFDLPYAQNIYDRMLKMATLAMT